MVTITHNHGQLDDCDSSSSYVKHDGLGPLDAAIAVSNGDYLDISGSFNGAGDEYCYYELTGLSISTTTYPAYLIRWKTSASASPGGGAKVRVVYSDASTETLLGGAGAAGDPEFSGTWTVDSGTMTTGKTVSKLQLWLDDLPDTLADATTYHAYYDFWLIHEGTFTLPNVAHGMDIDFPPREAAIPIPGKDVDATQNLGTQSAVVRLGCDLTQGAWKRTSPTADTIDGEMFLDMVHNRSSEPWQWLNTGSHQFKVSVHPQFGWRSSGESTTRVLDLVLREYSLGDKSQETYAERWGIGL